MQYGICLHSSCRCLNFNSINICQSRETRQDKTFAKSVGTNQKSQGSSNKSGLFTNFWEIFGEPTIHSLLSRQLPRLCLFQLRVCFAAYGRHKQSPRYFLEVFQYDGCYKRKFHESGTINTSQIHIRWSTFT